MTEKLSEVLRDQGNIAFEAAGTPLAHVFWNLAKSAAILEARLGEEAAMGDELAESLGRACKEMGCPTMCAHNSGNCPAVALAKHRAARQQEASA